MREVHLGAVQPGTKMIRVKIEVRDTDIRRTIVIPEDLTLEDFSDVVQVAIGWDGSHPWQKTRKMVANDKTVNGGFNKKAQN